jgi:hypothetical protein
MSGIKIDGYLQYLDREMTIMGVLSGFCLAALSFGLDAILSVEKTTQLALMIWDKSWPLVLTGAVLLLAAAYLFYEQRSALALLYGNITYWLARDDELGARCSLESFQDSRSGWNRYFFAHGAMICAFVAFLLALASAKLDWIDLWDRELSACLASLALAWVVAVFVRERIERKKIRKAQRHRRRVEHNEAPNSAAPTDRKASLSGR